MWKLKESISFRIELRNFILLLLIKSSLSELLFSFIFNSIPLAFRQQMNTDKKYPS